MLLDDLCLAVCIMLFAVATVLLPSPVQTWSDRHNGR